jgi:hypothetical protein
MADALSDRVNGTAVPETGATVAAGTSRALVPLTLPSASAASLDQAIRPDARFVAHLIASATFAPQTRALRRAAPDDAATTYSHATERSEFPVAANGTALSLVA